MANTGLIENTTGHLNIQEEIAENFTRVTEILRPYSGLDKINPEVLAHAGRRGSHVHNICEGVVNGVGIWELPEELKGYVNSFEKWWNQGHKVLAIEKRFFCSELMLTGQVDYIIDTLDGQIILDLKTSSRPSKTWPLQGSAYKYLAEKNGYDIQGIHFLHLSKNGIKPHLYVYDDNFQLFKKCLDIYRYFFERSHAKRKK